MILELEEGCGESYDQEAQPQENSQATRCDRRGASSDFAARRAPAQDCLISSGYFFGLRWKSFQACKARTYCGDPGVSPSSRRIASSKICRSHSFSAFSKLFSRLRRCLLVSLSAGLRPRFCSCVRTSWTSLSSSIRFLFCIFCHLVLDRIILQSYPVWREVVSQRGTPLPRPGTVFGDSSDIPRKVGGPATRRKSGRGRCDPPSPRTSLSPI
jgi:hypothetical protein